MKPKALAVCAYGIVRSGCMAWNLKLGYDYDTITIGVGHTRPDTLEMLCDWADVIIVMQTEFARSIPPQHINKLKICDVGKDVWGDPKHPELGKLVTKWLSENFKKYKK